MAFLFGRRRRLEELGVTPFAEYEADPGASSKGPSLVTTPTNAARRAPAAADKSLGMGGPFGRRRRSLTDRVFGNDGDPATPNFADWLMLGPRAPDILQDRQARRALFFDRAQSRKREEEQRAMVEQAISQLPPEQQTWARLNPEAFTEAMLEAQFGGGSEWQHGQGYSHLWRPNPDGTVTLGDELPLRPRSQAFVQWGPLQPEQQQMYPGLDPGDVQVNQATGEIRQIPGAASRARASERQARAVQSAMSYLESNERLRGAVLQARQRVQNNPTWTTGWLGARLRGIEGTDAYGLDRAIDTIKANLGFEQLQQMRQESPTGGALGQVAVIELQMLQAVIDSLESAQNHRDLLEALDNVDSYLAGRRQRMQRFLEAYQADFGDVQMGGGTAGDSGGDMGGGDAGGPPAGIPPDEWRAMTPEERARVRELTQ